MAAEKCPICLQGRLNKDETCPFASSHEAILKMRAERGNRQSERMQGAGNTSLERLRSMSRKAAAKRKKKKQNMDISSSGWGYHPDKVTVQGSIPWVSTRIGGLGVRGNLINCFESGSIPEVRTC